MKVPYMLPRSASDFDPARGLFAAEHFQMAYTTTDIARAEVLFRDRLGVGAFESLGGRLVEGGEIRARFAWIGTMLYEIIEARGPGSEIYMDRLPAEGGFHLRHHHLGFLLHDRAQWDATLAKAAASGWPMVRHSTNALVEVCFVDAPELGHYLEYLLPTEAGLAFFNNVPRY